MLTTEYSLSRDIELKEALGGSVTVLNVGEADTEPTLFLSINLFGQEKRDILNRNLFEYAILTHSIDPLSKDYIKIRYSDGKIEDYCQIKGINIKSNHHHLGESPGEEAIIKAFDYIVEKGYELASSHTISFADFGPRNVYKKKK